MTLAALAALLLCLSGCAGRGEANRFNPWMHDTLPSSHRLSDDGRRLAGATGGRAHGIGGETSHRPNARHELYPVVFGSPLAPQEIIVLLNFADPRSEAVWKDVRKASASLDPNRTKIVVFAYGSGNANELYGIDLMGVTIRLVSSRPERAMPWLDHALARWNAIKKSQKAAGHSWPFRIGADAGSFHLAYLAQAGIPVPRRPKLRRDMECELYDAGNVNAFQGREVARHYRVDAPPAVIVDGARVSPDSAAILAALR